MTSVEGDDEDVEEGGVLPAWTKSAHLRPGPVGIDRLGGGVLGEDEEASAFFGTVVEQFVVEAPGDALAR
jgi:hypothetical protein